MWQIQQAQATSGRNFNASSLVSGSFSILIPEGLFIFLDDLLCVYTQA
jgi:hypothetical protein